MPRSLLRLPEVMHRTGLSRSAVYRGVAAGTFPPPVPIGKRVNGWVSTEIDDFVEATIRAARQPDALRRPPVARRKVAAGNAPASAPATE